MRLFSKIGRRLASLAVVGMITAAGITALAAPASAAVTYWTFRNLNTGECLTGGARKENGNNTDNGVAYVTDCRDGAENQQWDWVDSSSSYKQLKNNSSELCLMTDNDNLTNAVWTSECKSGLDGQRWYYGDEFLASRYSSWLRTSPRAGAVYSEHSTLTFDDWVGWDGDVV